MGSKGMKKDEIWRKYTGLLFTCIVLFPAVESGNPYKYAAVNVRCKLNGYKVKIKQPGCQIKAIMLNTCVGACIGSSVPDKYTGYNMVTSCDSCKIRESVDVYVELYCRGTNGPFTKFHRVRGAKSCHCARCS